VLCEQDQGYQRLRTCFERRSLKFVVLGKLGPAIG